jgi:hypothetical protein
MSPALFDMEAPPPPPPVELSHDAVASLRRAGRWSRFLAVTGFVVSGLFVVAGVFVILAFLSASGGGFGLGNAELVLVFVPIAIALVALLSGSALLWGYGKNLLVFFQRGEPALTRSFQNLRFYFTLWTLAYVLTMLVSVISVVRKLL